MLPQHLCYTNLHCQHRPSFVWTPSWRQLLFNTFSSEIWHYKQVVWQKNMRWHFLNSYMQEILLYLFWQVSGCLSPPPLWSMHYLCVKNEKVQLLPVINTLEEWGNPLLALLPLYSRRVWLMYVLIWPRFSHCLRMTNHVFYTLLCCSRKWQNL